MVQPCSLELVFQHRWLLCPLENANGDWLQQCRPIRHSCPHRGVGIGAAGSRVLAASRAAEVQPASGRSGRHRQRTDRPSHPFSQRPQRRTVRAVRLRGQRRAAVGHAAHRPSGRCAAGHHRRQPGVYPCSPWRHAVPAEYRRPVDRLARSNPAVVAVRRRGADRQAPPAEPGGGAGSHRLDARRSVGGRAREVVPSPVVRPRATMLDTQALARRPEDVAMLAESFLDEMACRHGLPRAHLTSGALGLLLVQPLGRATCGS